MFQAHYRHQKCLLDRYHKIHTPITRFINYRPIINLLIKPKVGLICLLKSGVSPFRWKPKNIIKNVLIIYLYIFSNRVFHHQNSEEKPFVHYIAYILDKIASGYMKKFLNISRNINEIIPKQSLGFKTIIYFLWN